VAEAQNAAPAGWYPIADGSTQLRYWDGAAWTNQIHDPATPATIAAIVPRQPLRAPDGTSPNTLWVWLIALWPVLSLLSLVPTLFYLQGIADTDYTNSNAVIAAALSPAYFLIAAAGLVVYLVLALFSALDYRALTRAGVPQPFHWAWAFLSGWIYVIGRGVVVRRRTGRGLAPMWVFIALEIAIFAVSFVIAIIFTIEITSQLSRFAISQAGYSF
jgi:hypothetical protein